MNKKFLSAILFGALTVASTGSFVSCKDYDDDINNLQTQISQLASKTEMQSSVSSLQSAIASAQSAAEQKAAAAQKDASDAKAEAAAAKAAAATASTEAAKAAAEAAEKAAAEKVAAAEAAINAANEKIASLEAAQAELKAFAEGLASKEDFEAAKTELNKEFAALKESIEKKAGTFGMTGLSIVDMPAANVPVIKAAYGKWAGVHKGNNTAEWAGKRTLPAVDDPTTEFGTPALTIAVNPTNYDLSNTEFAVVNQYGDRAPIAFGTPVAPTRALTAGVYELPYKVGKVEEIAAFVEAFEGEGGTATLVAAGSNIAAQVRKNFVKVEPALNADKSDFKAKVAYEDIDGSVDLVAVNPEKVYDAYIVKSEMDQHDSLIYKLPAKYDGGLTISYNAATVKSALAKSSPVTMKFTVDQINLNGYIHQVTGVVEFYAKDAAKPVEKEAVTLDEAIPHTAEIIRLNAVTGKNVQLVNVSAETIKNVLGFGMASDDSTHYAHSDKKVFLAGNPYIYTADEDTVQVAREILAFDEENKDLEISLNNEGNYSLEFAANYAKTRTVGTGANAKTYNVFLKKIGTNDVDLLNGYTVYFPLKVQVVDNKDFIDNPEVTNYYVNVPVKFSKPNLANKYTWSSTEISASSEVDLKTTTGLFKPAKGYESQVSLFVENVDEKTAAGQHIYYHSSMTAAVDYSSLKEYEKAKKAINDAPYEPAEDVKVTVNGTKITVCTAGTTFDSTAKSAKIAEIERKYLELANAKGDAYTAYITAANKIAYRWETTSTPNAENVYKVSINAISDKLKEAVNVKVSGLKIKVASLDRTYDIPTDLVLTRKYTAEVNPSMTTTAAKVANNTWLYNSTVAPIASALEQFAGSFTLKTSDNKTLNLARNSIFSNYSYKWYGADGKELETAPDGASVTMATQSYYINDEDMAMGIAITVTSVPETVKKVKITFDVDNCLYNGTTAEAGKQEKAEVTFNL